MKADDSCFYVVVVHRIYYLCNNGFVPGTVYML